MSGDPDNDIIFESKHETFLNKHNNWISGKSQWSDTKCDMTIQIADTTCMWKISIE